MNKLEFTMTTSTKVGVDFLYKLDSLLIWYGAKSVGEYFKELVELEYASLLEEFEFDDCAKSVEPQEAYALVNKFLSGATETSSVQGKDN